MIPNKTSGTEPQYSQQQQCSAVPISSFPAQCIQSTVRVVVTAAAAGDKGEGEQETASRSLGPPPPLIKYLAISGGHCSLRSRHARALHCPQSSGSLARPGAEDERWYRASQ